MIFEDRVDAGQKLASKLTQYKEDPDTVVIGLPRGGVIVANEVANNLKLTLDIIVPRKIGAPGNPELAIGAITEEGEGFFDEAFIRSYQIDPEVINKEVTAEKEEARRRLELYRGSRPALNLNDKTAILIDDGIATGSTMKAAIVSAKIKGADKVVVAVPVAPPSTIAEIKNTADEVVVLDQPPFFQAVGQFYADFSQTEDAEIIELMSKG